MNSSHTAMRLFATLIGVACIAVDIGLNLEFQMKADDGKLTAMAAALVLASIAATILPSFAIHSWKQGNKLTSGFSAIAFAGLAALTLSTSLERSSAAREHVLDKRKTYNIAYHIADREYKDLKKLIAKEEATLKTEYVKGICDTRPDLNCPKWHKAKLGLVANNKKLPAAYHKLRKSGAPKTIDPAAQSLEKFGIPAEIYAKAQPLFLPFGLFFAGIAAIGVATGSNQPKPSQRRTRVLFPLRRMRPVQSSPRQMDAALPVTRRFRGWQGRGMTSGLNGMVTACKPPTNSLAMFGAGHPAPSMTG